MKLWVTTAMGVVLFSLMFGCLSASASVITFDEFEAPGSSFTIHLNPVDVGDFRFTATGSAGTQPITVQQDHTFYNGSASLTTMNSGDLVMTRIDGGAFGLSSIDLDKFLGSPGVFEITGQLSGGGTVRQLFTADNLLGGETVNLSGFLDITSLEFGAVGADALGNIGSVDNIVVVPEPATFALLALSLAGLGLGRRRLH